MVRSLVPAGVDAGADLAVRTVPLTEPLNIGPRRFAGQKSDRLANGPVFGRGGKYGAVSRLRFA